MNDPKDPRFDDGVPARRDFRDLSPQAAHGGRKTLQLCAQVRRALELALVGVCADPVLQDLMVLDVRPAPDASRLEVVLQLPPDADPADCQRRLDRARPLLVDEVAHSIHRRKVPDLAFRLQTQQI